MEDGWLILLATATVYHGRFQIGKYVSGLLDSVDASCITVDLSVAQALTFAVDSTGKRAVLAV